MFIILPIIILPLIYWRGTLRHAPIYRIPVLLALSVIVIGLLFKIEHWAGASELLTGGSLVLVLAYTHWFGRKPSKSHLDILKLLFVASAGLSIAFAFVSPMLFNGLNVLRTLSFGALLLDFAYVSYQGRRRRVGRPQNLTAAQHERAATNPPAEAG